MKEETKLEKWVADGCPPIDLNKFPMDVVRLVGELNQYNGISPSTVTEMIEALRYTLTKTHDDHVYDVVNEVLSKADKELKK